MSNNKGTQMAQSVKRLPLAQVMILESWDWALLWAPYLAGSLLPLPLPQALSLKYINKIMSNTYEQFTKS